MKILTWALMAISLLCLIGAFVFGSPDGDLFVAPGLLSLAGAGLILWKIN